MRNIFVFASILIALVAAYQYSEETQDYHKLRLERKEISIKRHINFIIKETSFEVVPEKLPLIFKDEILLGGGLFLKSNNRITYLFLNL